MSRKITYIMLVLIAIASIAIVAFFGIAADNRAQTIPVEEVLFVQFEGGNAENKAKRNLTSIKEPVDTLEIYFFVAPENATNRQIDVRLGGNPNCDKIAVSQPREGVVLLDFLGEDFGGQAFEVTLDTQDGHHTSIRTYSFDY